MHGVIAQQYGMTLGCIVELVEKLHVIQGWQDAAADDPTDYPFARFKSRGLLADFRQDGIGIIVGIKC